jgi:hypothetical protein
LLPDLHSLTPPIESVHPVRVAVPGRARFHVDGLYQSATLKDLIERGLAAHHQVTRVSANPRTGNFLVEFVVRVGTLRVRIRQAAARMRTSTVNPLRALTICASSIGVRFCASIWLPNAVARSGFASLAGTNW